MTNDCHTHTHTLIQPYIR